MPATESAAIVHEAVVCDRREPAAGTIVIGVTAPALARDIRPGQFVMAMPPSGERVSTALGVYEAEGDRVSFMLAIVGPRTRELALLAPGDRLSLFGPLGNGFDCAGLGRDVALIAGGVGLAPLLLPARELLSVGASVHLYYGARTGAALADAELFERLGCGVSLASDDGTRGHHGFVTELFAREARRHESIAACGPSPMLRAVGSLAEKAGIRAQLSLEETFACGVGACWGCVVALDRSSPQAPAFPPVAPGEHRTYVHARICREGPVFWAHELRW